MVTKTTQDSKESSVDSNLQRFPIFVHSELDDLGLDPYEFRVYARIARRAGKGNAFESIKNMALGCRMSEGKLKSSLRLLVERRLIKRVSRPGATTIYQLTLITDWVVPINYSVDTVKNSDEPSTPDVHLPTEVDTEQPGSSSVHHPGHEVSGGGSSSVHHPGHEVSGGGSSSVHHPGHEVTTKVFPQGSSTSSPKELVEDNIDQVATTQPLLVAAAVATSDEDPKEEWDKEKAIEEVLEKSALCGHFPSPSHLGELNSFVEVQFPAVFKELEALKTCPPSQRSKIFGHALRMGRFALKAFNAKQGTSSDRKEDATINL